MFQLRRYFSLTSLIAFIIVTILLGMLYRAVAVKTFVQLEESKNVALTQVFANALWPKFAPLLAAPQPPVAAQADAHLLQLRRDVIAQMTGLAVVKIKLYDRQGNTLFSTETSQIGENDADNQGYQSALQGQVASELTYRDTFSAFEGVIEDQNLLSTYLPVRADNGTGEILAVFELYSNVTPLLQRINQTQWQLMGGVGLILACLYGLLFLVVTRAEQLIHTQHAAQQQADLALRQQQRTLAILQERERLARELHDSLGQVLGYVNTQTQAARLLLTKGKTEATDELLLRLVKVAKNAHSELRSFILQLQTGESSDQPLIQRLRLYLQQYQEAYNIQTNFVVAAHFAALALPAEANDQIYRIVQEALHNVYKHAGAARVTVTCNVLSNEAQVAIQDNGQGFDVSQLSPSQGEGLGLQGMKTRALALAGQLEVIPQLGQGTTVLLRFPLQPESSPTPPVVAARLAWPRWRQTLLPRQAKTATTLKSPYLPLP